jgi:Uma2 family endonuclease
MSRPSPTLEPHDAARLIAARGEATPDKPKTYLDLDLLDEGVHAELVSGEIVVSPPGGADHVYATTEVAGVLSGQFGRRGLGTWWIVHEPVIRVAGDSLIPDIAGWRTSRMPGYPQHGVFTTSPDWVAEVLSPSTRRYDEQTKLRKYLSWGVSFVWLVDPGDRHVRVFEACDGRWTLAHDAWDDGAFVLPPFDGAPLEVGAWWVPGGSANEETG